MKTVAEMQTIDEVESLIRLIDRDDSTLRSKAEHGPTAAERLMDAKLDAMCKALERIDELKKALSHNA